MENVDSNNLWVSVKTVKGFIAELKTHKDICSAEQQAAFWTNEGNVAYDDVAIFEIPVSELFSNRISHTPLM